MRMCCVLRGQPRDSEEKLPDDGRANLHRVGYKIWGTYLLIYWTKCHASCIMKIFSANTYLEMLFLIFPPFSCGNKDALLSCHFAFICAYFSFFHPGKKYILASAHHSIHQIALYWPANLQIFSDLMTDYYRYIGNSKFKNHMLAWCAIPKQRISRANLFIYS